MTESLDIYNHLCYTVVTLKLCTIRLAVRIPACHAGDHGFESRMVRTVQCGNYPNGDRCLLPFFLPPVNIELPITVSRTVLAGLE